METLLAPRVEAFRDQQFKWAKELGIERADLKYGAAKAGTERSKPVMATAVAKLRTRTKATAMTVKATTKPKPKSKLKPKSKATRKRKAKA
ncbi:hypothetical protein PM082_022977 [Marasmius tenuissimus]|nr:hypothetical protein PM082_022977 [Marasmius tenuissimus]